MEDSALRRYVEIRRQLIRLEEELKALKPEVAELLRRRDGRVRFDDFDLVLQRYTAWRYSPRIEEWQRQLLEARRQEREDGTATVRERRDMLVLRPRGTTAPAVHEEAAPYDEWEPDDVPPP